MTFVCVRTEVQWMYKCDKPGSEEYLLGRRIDKHIEEPKESEETDKGLVSFRYM